MARDTTAMERVRAQISAREDGRLYIPVKARDLLGVGYGDEVEVKLSHFGGRDESPNVKGCLDSSGHFTAGKKYTDPIIHSEEEESTAHAVAEVHHTGDDWERQNEDTAATRWESLQTLAARLL